MSDRYTLRQIFLLTAVAAFISAAFAQWGMLGVFAGIVTLALLWQGGACVVWSVRERHWTRYLGVMFGSMLLFLGVILGVVSLFPWVNGPTTTSF